MTQVTIRQIDEKLVSAAKAKAAERGVSMNTVLKEAVKRGLGIVEKKKSNGLERFAGSCPDEFGEDWKKRMAVFDEIDEVLWK
jgi:selenocysteine-specific translation elongation factor